MQMHVAGAGPVGLMLTALLQPMERLPVVMAATKYGSGSRAISRSLGRDR